MSAIAGLTLMPSKVVTVETGIHSMAFSGRFKSVRAKMFSRTYLIFLQICHALRLRSTFAKKKIKMGGQRLFSEIRQNEENAILESFVLCLNSDRRRSALKLFH